MSEPKKFLRKGEGLKRFATYRPPLLRTNGQRRQTFVKFKSPDTSLSLSDEVPKIPPPKIMHTPIRPIRPIRQGPALNSNHNNNNNTQNSPPKRYNLRRPKMKAIVERHIPPSPDDMDDLLRKIEERKTDLDEQRPSKALTPSPESSPVRISKPCSTPKPCLAPKSDLSTPSPGTCLLALGKQIQQIQEALDDLNEKMKNCRCDLAPTARSRRAKKARTSSGQAETPQILTRVMEEVSQLKARFDKIQLKE